MARIFMAMNGKKLNSLDDLRTNFNANQMLSFYKGGRLQKWLEEIGAAEELENINSFESGYDDDTLLSMLMAVFELDDEQIEKITTETAKETEAKQESIQAENKQNSAVKNTPKEQDAESLSGITETEVMHESENPGETVSKEGLTWNVCLFDTKESNGELTANCQTIPDNELAETKLISGTKKHYNVSRAFFFDGYFWAQIYQRDNYTVTWAKSQDCVHWTIDKDLNKLLEEKSFSAKRIKVSDKHVFMLSRSNEFISYSRQTGWTHHELDMDSVYDTEEYESDLEDIFEGNGYAGILGVRSWQTGVFKKENNYEHKIHICQDLLQATPSDFSELFRYSNYECDDPLTYVFKDYLFVTSDEEDNGFTFASLDAQSPDFNSVELPDDVTVTGSSKFFIFPDAMFIISEKLIFTTDGLEWKECDIDSDQILAVVNSGNCFFAIAEGRKKGTCVLYKSQTGDIWEKVQNFCFSVDDTIQGNHRKAPVRMLAYTACNLIFGTDNVKNIVAGNNTILLFNGSTSGKYIKIDVESLTGKSTDSSSSNYLNGVKEISQKVKAAVAKELGIAASVITDDTDLVNDLHAEEWRIKLLGYQLGEILNVKFPNGEIPTKVIDIIISAVKNKG